MPAFAANAEAAPRGKKAAPAAARKAQKDEASSAPARAEKADPDESSAASDAESGEAAGTVRAAGTKATVKPARKGAVREKEGPEGVKTYEFGAIEVEGRLRSPQLLYFLRRVRAEFDAGVLGHRSFMGELRTTRHQPAFR